MNKPDNFSHLVGINKENCDQVLQILPLIWFSYLARSYSRPGRSYQHNLGSMVIIERYYRQLVDING